MNVPGVQVAGGLRQIRRAVLIAYAFIALLFIVAVVGFLANRRAVDSLCTLRSDLQTRVTASQKFLDQHPNGIAGIPPKAIRDGIANQQRTIKALQGLSCPAPK